MLTHITYTTSNVGFHVHVTHICFAQYLLKHPAPHEICAMRWLCTVDVATAPLSTKQANHICVCCLCNILLRNPPQHKAHVSWCANVQTRMITNSALHDLLGTYTLTVGYEKQPLVAVNRRARPRRVRPPFLCTQCANTLKACAASLQFMTL